MKELQKLNINPGYAVLFSGGAKPAPKQIYLIAKKHGLTFQELPSPAPELEGVLVVRRFNLPNLAENAYIYLNLSDFNGFSDDEIHSSVEEFVREAVDVEDIGKGNVRFLPERIGPQPLKCCEVKARTRMPMFREILSSFEDDGDEDFEVNDCMPSASPIRAVSEDEAAAEAAQESADEILEEINRLIKMYALQKHTLAPIDRLLKVAKSRMVIAPTTPSPIHVSEKKEVTFPGFKGLSLDLTPRMRVVYALFLSHPKGIFLNSLDDYLQEVIGLIKTVAPNGKYGLDIDTARRLCTPKSDVMNEVISGINKIIRAKFHPYSGMDTLYTISGSRGEVYKIEMAGQTIFA